MANVQLVSSGWIAAMTTANTDIPDRPQQYGYLWWLDQIRSPGPPKGRIWIAWGTGGNFLVLMPEQRAIAVFSGTRFNRPEGLVPLVWVRDRILPELRDSRQRLENGVAQGSDCELPSRVKLIVH